MINWKAFQMPMVITDPWASLSCLHDLVFVFKNESLILDHIPVFNLHLFLRPVGSTYDVHFMFYASMYQYQLCN